jgi:hypothetical protein
MQRRMLAVLVLVLTSGGALVAQTSRSDPVDVQGRLGTQLTLNLPNKWEAALGYELRMIGNASLYQGSYLDGEVRRAVGKHLTLLTNYRYGALTDATSHRYGVGAEVERKMEHGSLSFRPMFQYQRKIVDDDEQGSREVLRTRLRGKVPFGKRVTLHGSVEPYFAFTGIYPVDNWRNTVGLQWEFMKKRKLDVYYIYRPDYAKALYNRTYHIFGAEVSTDVKFPR